MEIKKIKQQQFHSYTYTNIRKIKKQSFGFYSVMVVTGCYSTERLIPYKLPDASVFTVTIQSNNI